MSTNTPQVAHQSDFQKEASSLHLTAFFNPIKQAREKALKQIRAQSGHSPDAWETLDAAAGIKTGEEGEVEADSPYGYQVGIEHSDQVLNEQFVGSTLMDTLLGSGFSVNSSLATYVYTTQLRNAGRMEADIDMNPRARARQDTGRAGLDGVPLPMVHVDYELDGREMEVKRANGENPEEEPAREGRRAINRREAELLWDGWGGSFNLDDLGAFTVGGLNSTDADKAIQDAGSLGWSNPDNVLADIERFHDDIEGQVADAEPADIPLVSEIGAYLFVPRAQWGQVTRQDYESAATDEPLLDRIQRKYPYLNIVPAPRLDANTAIFMLDDSRYFQIVNAQGMTNTAWDIDGGYARRHKLVASRIPFVRIQPDGIRGIVRATGINA